jgi:hypothetical protein
MIQGAGFRVCGVVNRKFINSQGTFVALTLSCDLGDRKVSVDLKGFKESVAAANDVEQGDTIEVTGSIGVEKLTAKDKSTIQVDGRDKWVPSLVIKAIKVDQAKKKKPAPDFGSDDINF